MLIGPLARVQVQVQPLSCVRPFATPKIAACQASLSITKSLILLRLNVHWIGDAIQPSGLLLLPSIFPSIRIFSSELAVHIRCRSIGASASVLPVSIQDWFSIGLTGWTSLQSKGLSRIFSNTAVQKQQFFSVHLLYGPTLTSIRDYWKNFSFDYLNLCWQSDISGFWYAV